MAESSHSHALNSDIPPPVYNAFQNLNNPVPVYSEVAASSEHVLPGAQSVCSRNFIYKTDHLELCLGRSIWGMRVPVYGLHAKAGGSVKFKRSCSHVVALTVTVRLHGESILIHHLTD